MLQGALSQTVGENVSGELSLYHHKYCGGELHQLIAAAIREYSGRYNFLKLGRWGIRNVHNAK